MSTSPAHPFSSTISCSSLIEYRAPGTELDRPAHILILLFAPLISTSALVAVVVLVVVAKMVGGVVSDSLCGAARSLTHSSNSHAPCSLLHHRFVVCSLASLNRRLIFFLFVQIFSQQQARLALLAASLGVGSKLVEYFKLCKVRASIVLAQH